MRKKRTQQDREFFSKASDNSRAIPILVISNGWITTKEAGELVERETPKFKWFAHFLWGCSTSLRSWLKVNYLLVESVMARRGLRNRHKLAEMGLKTEQGSTGQDPQKADHQSIIFFVSGGAKSVEYQPMPVSRQPSFRESFVVGVSIERSRVCGILGRMFSAFLGSPGAPKYNLNRGIKKEIKKLYWHLRWPRKRHRMCGYLISFLSRSFAWPLGKGTPCIK